jgi:protein involved in polysaccharide export with SLBB domain
MSTSSLAVFLAVAMQAVPFDPAVFKGPHVTLDGLVRRPGGYVLQAGDTVKTVVDRAGGVTTDSPPVYVLARTRGTGQTHCIAAPGERLETRDNVIVAVKQSKIPLPAERCETALARLSR